MYALHVNLHVALRKSYNNNSNKKNLTHDALLCNYTSNSHITQPNVFKNNFRHIGDPCYISSDKKGDITFKPTESKTH